MTAEEYHHGALARLEDALHLQDEKRWSGCVYNAGRSVEAMLKALLRLQIPVDHTGHDLRVMLRAVADTQLLTGRDRERIENALHDVSLLWQNDLRYADDQKLMQRIKRSRLDRRVRGDALVIVSRRTLTLCEQIVRRGDLIWKRHHRRS